MNTLINKETKASRRSGFRKLLSLVAAACMLTGLAASRPAAAQEERSMTTPTGWWWLNGVSANALTKKANEGYRITDLEVEASGKFSAAFVKNEGAYAKTWWWYHGLTSEQVAVKLALHQARILDLETYMSGGKQRFAVVLVSNTGAQNKGWWWYYNVSPDYIAARVREHNGRIVDLDTYVIGGTRYYSAVMISNTGADQKGWWWYYNVSSDDIAAHLKEHKAQLVDIERNGPDAYTVVMQEGEGKYWYYCDESADGLHFQALQHGARLVDIEPFTAGGKKRFAGIMVNNSNALTTKMGEILRGGTDGVRGAYLKQVGGPVLAALMQEYVFEPASAIKVILHLHALREVDKGAVTLDTSIKWYQDYVQDSNGNDTSCPQDTNPAWEPLKNSLKEMMQKSDNRRTQAIRVKFGQTNINATAKNVVGMVNTGYYHKDGCAEDQIAHPNKMTLYDAGLLYEGVANGSLLKPTMQAKFHDLMAGKGYDFTGVWDALKPIIDEEASELNVAPDKVAEFKSLVQMHYKAGGYTINAKIYRALAGWVEIPFRKGGKADPHQYVFGIFNHKATNESNANIAFDKAKAEILREVVHDALKTW